MNFVDRFLNSITMYRLALYGLGLMALAAFILAMFGLLPFSPLALFYSGALLLTVCFTTNFLLAKLAGRAVNIESADITALILFLIMAPPVSWQEAKTIVLVAALAMLIKHVVTFREKHIFNPAAIALVVAGLAGSGMGIWWIGTPALLPVSLVVGLLIVRKIRRFPLLLAFGAAALVSLSFFGFHNGLSLDRILILAFGSYPLVFLGTIMLTEPLTLPPTRRLQILYGVIVGLLFGAQFSFGPIFSTPELALVIGNLFAFAVSPKYKLKLSFLSSSRLSDDVYEFIFSTPRPVVFRAGQYLEWTLPRFFLDSRGNRRFFTIASSPTEKELRLGVRIVPNGSRFKKELLSLKADDPLWAGSLSGDFTLPDDPHEKLVFIAGGIGITPFRSMAKYLIDAGEDRDVQLIYSCLNDSSFVYRDIFASAESRGWKTLYLATNTDGYLTQELLRKTVPDFAERTYYLSGPNAMVENYEKLLIKAGVHQSRIKTDYFPGF